MATVTPLLAPEQGSISSNKAAASAALESLLAIRFFEEAVDGLFARGLMHGTMHLSIGQGPRDHLSRKDRVRHKLRYVWCDSAVDSA